MTLAGNGCKIISMAMGIFFTATFRPKGRPDLKLLQGGKRDQLETDVAIDIPDTGGKGNGGRSDFKDGIDRKV